MKYEIKSPSGNVYGVAINIKIANLFAQALREEYREEDFTVHEV